MPSTLGGAMPAIRVQENNYYTIGRALDRGALGIIVPMVNSVEDAREVVRACKYPPQGGRSFGPFGTEHLGSDYAARINDEVYVAVQIETIRAVERAEEILSVEGIDGCWIGPADLGLSMGGRPEHCRGQEGPFGGHPARAWRSASGWARFPASRPAAGMPKSSPTWASATSPSAAT